ncbi:hypothetical protein [Microbispora hainanensis]|uniref:hypothetical protein n=1 Tax=Microbispora hainanensis TaxID=568844 RepID=UPI003251ACA3
MTVASPTPADAGDAVAGQSAIVPSSAEPTMMLNRPPRMTFPLSIKPRRGGLGYFSLIVQICYERRPARRPPSRMIQGKSDANPDAAIGRDRRMRGRFGSGMAPGFHRRGIYVCTMDLTGPGPIPRRLRPHVPRFRHADRAAAAKCPSGHGMESAPTRQRPA